MQRPTVRLAPFSLAPLSLAVTLALACGGAAYAQQEPPAGDSATKAVETPLAPAVVTATRTTRSTLEVPASVNVVTAQEIQDTQLRVNLSEGLGGVPGLVLLNRQNYAQDEQLSIRGFGARSTFGERGVRLYVDGVPANFPDGQGEVSHFPLNAADRVEVLRGPFSALYGNSSGGVVSLTTDLKPQPVRLGPSFAVGAYNTWRMGFDGKGGQGSNAFNVDVDRFHTGGYRDHDEARRDSTNIAALLGDTPLGSAHVFINAVYMPNSQDAMGLTRLQWQQNPQAASPQALQFNTRKSTRQETVGGNLVSNLTSELRLTTSAWIGSRGVTQYQAIPVSTEQAPTSPGGVINFNRDFGGGDLRLTYERTNWTTSAGLDVERELEHRYGFNNYVGSTTAPRLGVEGTLRQYLTNTVDSLDPYLQTEVRLGDRWIADAGVRSSHVKVNSNDNLKGGETSTSFTGLEPTAGLVYRITPRVSAYGAFGRGFETPTLTELAYKPNGQPGLNTTLQAATSDNAEIGIKIAAAPTLSYELAAYSVKTHNDLAVATNSGGRSTYTNVNETRRDGIEAGVRWLPAPKWSTQLAFQTINARFATDYLTCVAAPCTTPTLPVAAGNKLPGIPAQTLYAEAKYEAGWADLTAEARASSKIVVDDRNTDSAPGYMVFNFAIAHTFDVGPYHPRVFGRLDNVLNHGYVGSVIVNESSSRFFEPAATRTWMVGMDFPL